MWDRYFHKNVQDATRQMLHNTLSANLQILIRKLKSGTRVSKKALAMQCDLVSIFTKLTCAMSCTSGMRNVHHDMHIALCVTPRTAVSGKKSV